MKVLYKLILVYFVMKGTVAFFIYNESNFEHELQEIKKYQNFGEIEMCLNKKLIYHIKIKSRLCELLVLRKVVSFTIF